MQKNLGGDRLGSGAKIKVDLSNFGRSTFNQSRVWKSTAGVGMLIPCFIEVGTNGTTFDIDINTMGHTIPTIGPLFDGYKLQVDMFACPLRLYQGLLHNNAVNIGLKMNQVLLPQIQLGNGTKKSATNPSSLLNYLGIKGYHSGKYKFNAVPILAYYDIFKNYYANKQEENAKVIGWKKYSDYPLNLMNTEETNGGFQIIASSLSNPEELIKVELRQYNQGTVPIRNMFEIMNSIDINGKTTLTLNFNDNPADTNRTSITLTLTGDKRYVFTRNIISQEDAKTKKYAIQHAQSGQIVGYYWATSEKTIHARFTGAFNVSQGELKIIQIGNDLDFYEIKDFPLENIDKARRAILAKTELNTRVLLSNNSDGDIRIEPYLSNYETEDVDYLTKDFQGLCLKTYQSDIFNNWLNTDNIDLINEISSIAVDSNDAISIDAMILAKKVYNVLNRIIVAGGTYEDWQESVYGENALRRAESPIYIGGTSAQIQFEEVVSTAQTKVEDTYQPLGNLGGKGAMINKKGGSIIYKCEEPTIIMGIASITPYVSYSQGNNWIVTNLDNMDNFHKPELDGIGFQNLIENNVHWAGSPNVALAKQTAWINYQTAIDEVFGQFAIPKGEDKSLYFMTLQRDYEVNENGEIQDFTTYIDPSKHNYAFADNSLTAQNFWLQIGFNVQSRRKMAAYQIPNL